MRYTKTVVLAAAAVMLAGALAQPVPAQVSFDLAYSNLSQHGSWLVSAQYGHVWQPSVYNQQWNPYSDGHWVYTEMGWAWVSDYQWGAIPYHYGTWVSDPRAGWVWIPGNVWAPSWVVFRTGPDYIGWAPVPPGFSVGISMDMGGPSSYVYVSSRDFLAPNIGMSIIPMSRASLFMNNTTVVNNIVIQNNVVVNRGPDYRTVERATGHPIREQRIESVARVAPFANVTRAQLAVSPETVRQGVRVAEPVPASRPLPVADKRGKSEQRTSPAEAAAPAKGHQGARPNTQQPAAQPAVVNSTRDADAARKATAKTIADHTAQVKTNADRIEKTQANAKANADHSAQANPKPSTDQNAKAQADAKANADQQSRAPGSAKPNADQNAKAQADAKAKADANAKKNNSDKKDQGSE